jgi:hypothetical protein
MNKPVYVVRWLCRVNGEESCGVFEYCYTNERDAEKAMLEDIKNTTEEWQALENEYGIGETIHTKQGKYNDNGCIDYYDIWFEKGSFDYHKWWIDKLPVI